MLWLRIADYKGRRKLIILGLFLHILPTLLFLIKINPLTLYIGMASLGLKNPLTASLSYLLFLESVGPRYRAISVFFLSIVDGSSSIWLVLFYQFCNNWHILFYLNLSLACFLLIPFVLILKESPKFFGLCEPVLASEEDFWLHRLNEPSSHVLKSPSRRRRNYQ